MSPALPALLHDLAAEREIAPGLLGAAIDELLDGTATPVQRGALLMGLRLPRLTAEALAGAAKALRNRMLGVDLGGDLTDVCGTGGDQAGLLNISTATAFVAAACGLRIAKHGNRAMSSRSGGADLLEALGLRLDAPSALQQAGMAQCGLAFLFAQAHHPGLKEIAPARQELGFRTLFNVLGPLANPAGASQQVLGVFSPDLLLPMGQALANLGCHKAWIVHGAGGIDEVSISGPTEVLALENETFTRFTICPADAGLAEQPLDKLRGGDPEHNAIALRALLAGVHDAYRDAVVLNTAAALTMAGKAADLQEGARMAEQAIDSGEAAKRLAGLLRVQEAQE